MKMETIQLAMATFGSVVGLYAIYLFYKASGVGK